MDSVLLSTAYFPPIFYFSRLIHASNIIIEKEENFHKQTYRNRCIILGANGPLNLTVPIEHTEPKIKIPNLNIFYQNHWQLIHFRAIESAYRNSPYYEYYIDDFKVFFQKKPTTLFDLNLDILKTCLNVIGCKCLIEFTLDFVSEETDTDFRFISPKKEITDFIFPVYHQVFDEKFSFVPNLSILDLIFNLGPDTSNYLNSIHKKMDRFDSVHFINPKNPNYKKPRN